MLRYEIRSHIKCNLFYTILYAYIYVLVRIVYKGLS